MVLKNKFNLKKQRRYASLLFDRYNFAVGKLDLLLKLIVEVAASTHCTAAASALIFRLVNDNTFSGEDHASDQSCVLQIRTSYLQQARLQKEQVGLMAQDSPESKNRLKELQAENLKIETAHQDYQKSLQALSQSIHPFHLDTGESVLGWSCHPTYSLIYSP